MLKHTILFAAAAGLVLAPAPATMAGIAATGDVDPAAATWQSGTVSVTGGTQHAIIGDTAAGTGTVTVTDYNGGTPNLSVHIADHSDFIIGSVSTSNGTLYIQNGGRVKLTGSGGGKYVYLAKDAGSLGTINVTGTDGSGHASTFDLGSAMIEAYIGTSGTAVVNVTDGGYLYTKKNMVGNGSSANTTVTVSGTGSKWENRFDQYIGQGGTATLNILDGGWVQNEGDYLTIGNYGTAEGTVTVSGTDGTTASRLTGKLRVGGHFGAGTGTLKIADGGVVRITELRMSKAGGSGEIYMTNGGMLALDGDLDADLGTFLADIFIAEVQGDYTDEIKYGVPGNWADLTSTTSLAGIGSLTYYGSSTLINGVDMNGYTVLTITVPEPATLIVLVGGLPLVLRRKRS